jgi:hypothetical protein
VSTKRQHGVKLFLRGGEIVRIPTGQFDIGASNAKLLGRRIEGAFGERAGAALAALSTPEPTAKERIRVAAESSASPKLRVALTRIAEAPPGDEEALAEALAELDARS